MLKNLIIATLLVLLAGVSAHRLTTEAHLTHTIVPNPNIAIAFATPGLPKCDWYHTDINHDCFNNVGDRGLLLLADQNGWDAPTYTPTITPTPTFTSTPTHTPTATPTPMFSVTELIEDVSSGYPVQGSLCTPPANYNWGQEGHGLDHGPPEGTHVTPWWTAQWNGCGDSASGVTIVIDNFHAYGWTGSTWIEFGGHYKEWCGEFDPDTTSGGSACSPNPGSSCPSSVSGDFTMPTGQRSLHGAYCGQLDQNVACVVVVYRAKSTGSKDIIANSGSDHKNGGTNLFDMHISRYKLLNTSTWTQVGGTSCSASTVTNNPPPGF